MRSAASLHRVASMSNATKSKSSSRAIAPKVSKVVKKTVKSVAKHGVMTQKQKIFCDEYLIDLNATQAAIRAGYSQKTAQEQSSRLLSNVMVSDYIQALMNKRAAKIERTADDVLRDIELVKIDSMQKIADKDGNLVMANTGSALKALELEGKHRKMFTDKVEHSGALEISRIERVII